MDIKYYKLEIFAPESHFETVRQALWAADAGHIGNYDHCLSWSPVNSCWRSLEGTTPFNGTVGELTQAKEIKIEVCCQAEKLEQVLAAVKRAHPYEEPGINVIPMMGTGL